MKTAIATFIFYKIHSIFVIPDDNIDVSNRKAFPFFILEPESLLARLLKENNDVTTYVPHDEDLRSGFEHTVLINLQARGVLYLIESKIRSTASSTALLSFVHYSLEHLMPKKWRNNRPACEDTAAADRRDYALLTLGNPAIIAQSLNASMRDATWTI